MGKGYYAGNYFTKYAKASALRRSKLKSRKFGMSRSQFKGSVNTKFLSGSRSDSVFSESPMKRYKGANPMSPGEWNQLPFQDPKADRIYRKDGTYYDNRKGLLSKLDYIEVPLSAVAEKTLWAYNKMRRSKHKKNMGGYFR